MKKQLWSLAVMSVALFSACVSNNDNRSNDPYPVVMTNGVFVIGSGNQSNSIPGSLSYYDYTSQTATKDIFNSVNGQSLGMTANDVLRYGDKVYVVVDGENSVFVLNAKTLRMIHRINMTDVLMLGEEKGVSPRRVTADGDNIYVSTYGGYVAAIDTVSFQKKDEYKAGSYPEGVAVNRGYLYVANSDYGKGENPSISVINLSTKATTEIKNENIRNPQEIAVAGSDIYYLDWGAYGPAPTYAQEHAGVYLISGENVKQIIPNATGMTCYDTKIYTFNDPYGATGGASYTVYDIYSGISIPIDLKDIDSPAAIGIDPVTGYLFVASRQMDTSEWGTFPSYTKDGYVNFYDSSFTKKGSFTCGVGPTRIAFNTGVEYVRTNY